MYFTIKDVKIQVYSDYPCVEHSLGTGEWNPIASCISKDEVTLDETFRTKIQIIKFDL